MNKSGILIGALLFGFCLDAHSKTLSLGLSLGPFFPKEKTYRDIYGGSLPLDVEFRVGLSRHFGLAAGVSYVRDSGYAVNVNQGRDSYPVRFRMVSLPLTAYILFPLNKLYLLAGAGLCVHSYEEAWTTTALSFKGDATKPLVYAGVEYRVLGRVAARLALRYENIPSGKNAVAANEVNLGGLTLLAGVSVRIF